MEAEVKGFITDEAWYDVMAAMLEEDDDNIGEARLLNLLACFSLESEPSAGWGVGWLLCSLLAAALLQETGRIFL